ncbi:Uu.00g104990.m01.CDS01 [Anthostomella pinea]|uniref:Uu.00g104990.m01.CDS01 n=1 Tax=Anthostomella pinea TaxID=933095 RepID=A0AAI8YFW1_9PEZI|nr:Uu.00g104990.m01.CDS01 [Anthostomella pinea]
MEENTQATQPQLTESSTGDQMEGVIENNETAQQHPIDPSEWNWRTWPTSLILVNQGESVGWNEEKDDPQEYLLYLDVIPGSDSPEHVTDPTIPPAAMSPNSCEFHELNHDRKIVLAKPASVCLDRCVSNSYHPERGAVVISDDMRLVSDGYWLVFF